MVWGGLQDVGETGERGGGGRKTENSCIKISGIVDKMSHCEAEEEEEEENMFSRDLKIMSRDQEDKRVRACVLAGSCKERPSRSSSWIHAATVWPNGVTDVPSFFFFFLFLFYLNGRSPRCAVGGGCY